MANEIKKYLDTAALTTLVAQIKTEDAKVLKGSKDYADSLAKNYDPVSSAATAEANAKTYTDALANGAVKTNTEAIATLNGTGEGSVAKAVADAKTLIDADIDGVEAKADKNAEDILAINDGTNGILAQAKSYADAEDAKIEQEVANLSEYVGTIPEGAEATDIVGYVQEKTAGIATEGAMTELGNRVTAVEGDVATIKGDYLKKSDKDELAGDIADVQSALDGEIARADAAEKANAAAIKAISDDYLKAADKTELQNNINTVSGAVERLTNGVSAEEIDGVNDLIQYVKDHGTEVTGMQGDIAENAEAISGVAGRVETLEGEMDDVQGAVATKVEQSVYDAKVAELAGADTSLGNRISTLEGKFGGADGSVEDMIADAKAEAIETAGTNADAKDEVILAAAKKYADDEDAKIESRVDALETASETHALASDLTTLTGRVTTAEGDIDNLEGKMTAVETKAGNNETAIGTINTELAKKAAQSDLEAAVARIAKNETDIATKASDADLDDAVERIAKNETDIAANAEAIAANTSAINSFTAITPEEVTALFA